MESPASEPEVEKEAHCSTDLQPSSPNSLEPRGNVVKVSLISFYVNHNVFVRYK